MALNFITKDNLKLGISIGILIPFIALAIQYYMKQSSGMTWDDFIYNLKTEKRFLTGTITIGLVISGILFGMLVQFKRYETAKGLFFPTALLGLIIFIYKVAF